MKIFLDHDGTLAEFQLVGPSVWSKAGYSRGLAPLGNMIPAVKLMLENPLPIMGLMDESIDIYILSATVSDDAIADKKWWYEDQGLDIPEDHMIFVPYGKSKKEALLNAGVDIEPGDIFVDDYTKNLIEVDGFNGITAVKLMNGINDTHKTWNGQRISAFSSPSEIIKALVGISLVQKMLAA